MIVILRLEHRPFRDQRISTHCGLVSRALGASKIIYTGLKDDHFEKSIKGVTNNFGGKFEIEYSDSWRKIFSEYRKKKFKIVHLTMYGLEIQKQIKGLRKIKNILLVVGGEKVPHEVYQLTDFNIAVTNQPHSEVAGLAVFLHEYFEGKELEKKFKGKLKIIPQERGKKVEEKN